MNHSQLMKVMFLRYDDGNVAHFDPLTSIGKVAYNEADVGEDFRNLLRAAPAMYQTLSFEAEQLRALIEAAQCFGEDGQAIVEKLEDMLGPVEYVLELTREGIDKMIARSKSCN